MNAGVGTSRNDKQDARFIVERNLGLNVEPNHPASTGALGYDFNIIDGVRRRLGALKVVQASVGAPHAKEERAWEAPRLNRSWVLQPAATTKPDDIQRLVLRLLRSLERSGVDRFSGRREPSCVSDRMIGPVEPVLRKLASAGIVGGVATGTQRRPSAVLLKSSHSGVASAEAVNEIVEGEAWRESHRALLGSCEPGSRHLFVWLDNEDLEARGAMEADLPPEPPVAPGEISTLWVARRPCPESSVLADRVWRTNTIGEWESLGPTSHLRSVSHSSL